MLTALRVTGLRVAGSLQTSRPPPCLCQLARPPSSNVFTWTRHARKQRRCLQRAVHSSAASVEGAQASPTTADSPAVEAAKLDIRVGRIVKCEPHPDAESLYVEQIEVGEEEPRTIVSGLVKYVPLQEMQDRSVVVLCNLKPRNMRGIKSNGMLLCASDAAHEHVEPLTPPEGAAIGERVFFGEGGQDQPEAESPNKLQKKKTWEALQPDLKTSADRVAGYKGVPMLTSAGPVTAATLADGNIS